MVRLGACFRDGQSVDDSIQRWSSAAMTWASLDYRVLVIDSADIKMRNDHCQT